MNDAKKRLSDEEISLFCEQTALALRSGIPIDSAMETVCDSFRGEKGAQRFAKLRELVESSGSLADATEASGLFPQEMCAMTRIGESSGRLDDVMDALAGHYAWEASLKDTIRSAVAYPATLALILAAIIAVLLTRVMPVFTRVFASLGVDVSSGAASGVSVGVTIGSVALAIVALLSLALLAVMILIRTPLKEKTLRFVSKLLPAVGRVREELNRSRFASSMHIMLSAGCSIDQATSMAASSVEDEDYARRAAEAADEIASGAPTADSMEKHELFAPMELKLIRFGSSAGSLDTVLGRTAARCRESADNRIAGLVSMIEPVLVIILSVVIGGILVSVMLPLMKILTSMA